MTSRRDRYWFLLGALAPLALLLLAGCDATEARNSSAAPAAKADPAAVEVATDSTTGGRA